MAAGYGKSSRFQEAKIYILSVTGMTISWSNAPFAALSGKSLHLEIMSALAINGTNFPAALKNLRAFA